VATESAVSSVPSNRAAPSHDAPTVVSRGSGGAVEAVATQLYRRFGAAYLIMLAAAAFVIASLFAGFDTMILQMYRGVGTRNFDLLLAVGEGVNAVGMAVGFVAFALRPLVRLARWLRADDDAATARQIADLAAALPGRVVPPIALVIMVLEVPAILFLRGQLHFDVSVIVVLLAVLAPNATAAYFIYLILEQLLRPIVRKAVAGIDADDHRPPPATLTLRQKLYLGLPIVNFMTAYVTAAFVERATTLTGRITLGVAAALAVTLTVSMVLTTTLVHAFSEPVRKLMNAADRVHKGDLTSTVPALTNDELGQLTESFNQMVGGLQQRAKLQSAMGAYIDPTIAERVAQNGGHLGSEAVDVTVMFVDIIGFTKLAENADPSQVVAILNEFFHVVIPPIERNGGHANKLLGDGLMAVFGVPLHLSDHADRSLTAALEITSALHARYCGDLAAGIGLNSGVVVVGSMGGGGKLDYTIVGDVVNVAARVEAYTRQTGDSILLTDATRSRLTNGAQLRPRGPQSVKGRGAPVVLWSPEVRSE
jgi:class 3 adenylate cyclase